MNQHIRTFRSHAPGREFQLSLTAHRDKPYGVVETHDPVSHVAAPHDA
ncbi:hypothetical protein ACFCZT_10360 [Streptomyces sp. NPDC056230]